MYVMGYNTRKREELDKKFDTFYIVSILGITVLMFEVTTVYGFDTPQAKLSLALCGAVVLVLLAAALCHRHLKRKNPSLEQLVVKYKNNPLILVNNIFTKATNNAKYGSSPIADMDIVSHSTNEQYDDYLRFLDTSKRALRSATTANFESVVQAIKDEAHDLAHEMTTNAYIVRLSQKP